MPGIFTNSFSVSSSLKRHRSLVHRQHSSQQHRQSSVGSAASSTSSDSGGAIPAASVLDRHHHSDRRMQHDHHLLRRDSTGSSTESSSSNGSDEYLPVHRKQQFLPIVPTPTAAPNATSSSTAPLGDDGWGHFVDITW